MCFKEGLALLLVVVAAKVSLAEGRALEEMEQDEKAGSDGYLWIPDLRASLNNAESGNNLLDISEMEAVAGKDVTEVGVDSAETTIGPRVDIDETQVGHKESWRKCRDANSKVMLYVETEDHGLRSNRPLTLTREVWNLGRFDGKDRGRKSSTPFDSVEVQGKCCWEIFTMPEYGGKMLRLCRGKYIKNILGRFSGNLRSLKPVEYY